MICMEEDGMKKVLFEIVVPAVVLALWMITCYPVCCKAEGFDYFLYWILVGCPYGIRKMCLYSGFCFFTACQNDDFLLCGL